MKILTIVGARPQFIKAATVSRAVGRADGVEEVIVHTGQHYDENMSDVFFRELEIPKPHYHLGVGGGSHGHMTGQMLTALEDVMVEARPDWVLVYGDTNSTLAGALAAAKLNIPIAHVEAGLRSFNRRMPEEVNRVLTDHAADLLLSPTAIATANLLREGVSPAKVKQVGDVMYDATLFYRKRAEQSSGVMTRYSLPSKGFVLATVHRQENTDSPERLRAIFAALQVLAAELPVVVPLHPRTKKMLEAGGLSHLADGLTVLPPVGYLDMVMLEKEAAVVATDSGGVQKEAYFHGVPCVTLRNETEWVELVDMGWNRLAPPETADIAGSVREAISNGRGRAGIPYGEGKAADAVLAAMGMC